MLVPVAVASLLLQPTPFTPEFGLFPGERYEFRVSRLRTQTGRPDGEAVSSLRIEFLPLDPLSKGRYVLRCTTDAVGAIPEEALSTAGLSAEDLQTTIDVVFDAHLQFYEVVGWRNVRDRVLEATERIAQSQVRSGRMPPEAAEAAREIAESMTQSHDAILLMSIRNIAPWFSGYSWWDLTEKGETFQDVMPSPFGTDPIPAITTARLADDPETPDRIEFRMEQRVDSEAMGAHVAQLMDRFGPEGAPAARALQGLGLVDTIEWSYDPETAIIDRTVHERRVTAGDTERFERTIWELVWFGEMDSPYHPLAK